MTVRRPLQTLLRAAALCGALAAPAHAQPQPSQTDYFKEAGNFLENCDARPDESGERPDEDYLCLSFMAGLIEGYTYAAIANGNARPYCLPRPVTLVELLDMLTTVIERGVPPQTPTAAVFHFLLEANFSCGEGAARPEPGGEGAASPGSAAQP